MAVDERARHDLYRKLADVIGSEETGTLMSLLPPVGWADVATRHDLDSLRHGMDADLARLESTLQREMRQMLFAMLGALFTMTGIILAFG